MSGSGGAGRLSWVEEGATARAPWPTWTIGLIACALAVLTSLATLVDLGLAVVAASMLCAGALAGRLLRLESAFRSAPAWMWAIGAGSVCFVASAWSSLWAVAVAVGLVVLPLDWAALPRLRVAVGAGLVFATLAVVSRPAPPGWLLGVWALLAVVTLLLVERGTRRAGRQAGAHRPPGHVPHPGSRARTWRDGATLAAVAVTSVVLAVVLLPPPAPDPSPGRSGSGGQSDPTYPGFDATLDTADRTPLTDEVVLRVRATSPGLWRGDSFDQFDGRRWTHSDTRVQGLSAEGSFVVPRTADLGDDRQAPSADADPPLATEEQVQVFTFERGGNDLVFGANRPHSVLAATSDALWYPGSDAVRLAQPLGRGGSYTVLSVRPLVTPDALRALDRSRARAVSAASATDDGVGPGGADGGRRGRPGYRRGTADEVARYLQVPATVTERTRQLARSLTAEAPTAYDKVRSLEGWMAANTRYRLDIPPLPEGRDAVDQFLFEDRQGYCEQIATALTVMLRVLGVPARLAVGYVPDHQDAATGEWIVLDRGAHAWVEVWWPGVGWQGFDPTADVPLAPDSGASTASSRFVAVVPWLAAVGAAALVAAVGAGIVARARQNRRAETAWLDQAVARLLAVGEGVGRPRRPSETLPDFAVGLDADTALAGHGAPEVARRLSGFAFGRRPPTAPDRAELDAALTRLEGVADAVRRSRRRSARELLLRR